MSTHSSRPPPVLAWVLRSGVRMVASAHGDLQSLLQNPELNTLVGGTTSVTLGDKLAQDTNEGNKVRNTNGELEITLP